MGDFLVGSVEDGVVGGRRRDAVGAVDHPLGLRVGRAVVGDELVVSHCQRKPYPGRVRGHAVVLHAILEGVLAVGNLTDLLTHPAFGVVHQLDGSPVDELDPVLVQQCLEAALGDVQRANHGVKVAPGVRGRAMVVQDYLPDILHVLASPHDLHQGQPQPLLVDVRGGCGEGAWSHPSESRPGERCWRRSRKARRRSRPA